MKFRKTA
jgi:dynein heavy chain